MATDDRVRVLSVDGGGVRGIIPAHVLVALEEMTGRPSAELFDVMVGTSIGGIGVLALSRPDAEGQPSRSAADLLEFFVSRAGQIFSQPGIYWPRSLRELEEMVRRPSQSGAVLGFNREIGNARYSPEGLGRALDELLGTAMLGEALTDVVVTSYDVRAQRPTIFRSADVRAGRAPDRPAVDVALASSAAPTYFPAVEMDDAEPSVLVDGGVYASAPSMLAFVEGIRLARARGGDERRIEVVSLGTGAPPPRPELTHREFIGRSWFRLAQAIFEAAQVGQSSLNDDMLEVLLGERYWRFDVVVADEAAMAMDDSSVENLAVLDRLGLELVARRIGDLHRLAEHLT